MPIAALPQTTVRAIGSTSVISDPCSIVKELLENSLDAHATAIFIEISQNTVDVIQVKDNGHGIPSEDHPFVCRRAFTSKIATVDDLRKLGGKSLGFRGEALASAAEVCGGVTVTTRVEADPVGFCVKYGRNGELIRLSLKVLKAASEKANWVYAPGRNAALVDAALKVAGTEVASACVIKQWPCGNESDVESGSGGDSFQLTALLADPALDFSKVNNAGQFFSVDGRPLSASRGIGQEISKLYKSYLRAAASRSGGLSNVSDPFLCLQIRCPEACYDVNVEPAKDDVLFENRQDVLSLAEDLFRDIYGENPDGAEKRKSSAKGKERMSDNDAFDLLLARKDSTQCSVETGEGNKPPSFVTASSLFHMSSSQKSGRNEQRLFGDGSPGVSGQTRNRDLEGLNPWSATRLYAPCGPPSHKTPSKGPTRSARLPARAQELEPRSSTDASPSGLASSASPSASTPNSNRLSHSPTESRSSASVSDLTQTSPITPLHGPSVRRASRQRDRERYGNGALDTWFLKTTQESVRQEPVDQRPENEHDEPLLSQLPEDRFAQRERPPVTSDTTAPRTVASGSPGPSEETSMVESSGTRGRASEPAQRRLDQWSANLHRLANADHNPDLERALDFEKRKKEAITRLREQRKNTSTANSPHLSRYLAAKAALQPEVNNSNAKSASISATDDSSPRLNPHDPRSYLMRNKSAHDQRRLASDPAKLRRIQKNKLPFEKIPEGCELHGLCLAEPAAIPLISKTFRDLYEHDLYTRDKDDFAGFTAADLQFLSFWEGQLSPLIKEKFRTIQGSDLPTIQINLSDLHQHLGDLDGGSSASA
ncbi:hypothetical protein CNMCM5793_005131 [Aspergillus hiratsukae]|uniref:DNA mismatch repair protein S5 domain-containing protein n=1 Tax=Aspergillus hiratsukae TaxID=1194566 RepID=A0A8H6UXZ6_9EURO|nr:hypothetical protein CNMCM5793_005131 [Aspergillus hiratsukae]KAF7170877.1 hypothetical protein CNMCM6106_005425 [Aspergillus hiratsukae]